MLDWDKKDYLTAVYNDREKELFQEEATTLGINVETLARECQRHNQYFERQFGYKPSLSRLPDTSPNIDTPSWSRIKKTISDGNKELDTFLKWSKNQKQLIKLFWAGDMHLPKEHRQAWDLTNQIRADFRADIEPRGNDMFDFESYGKWDDYNPDLSCQLWLKDVQFAFNYLENREREALSAHTPLFKPLITGNHEIWAEKFLLNETKGFGPKTFADYLQFLASLNYSVLSHGKMNTVKLSPGFKIIHGTKGNGQNVLEDLAGRDYEDDNGIFYNVLLGHFHRSNRIDKFGVTAYTAPCLQDATKTSYGDRHKWQLGIVLGYYDANNRNVEMQQITYKSEHGKLVAYWGDKRYVSK